MHGAEPSLDSVSKRTRSNWDAFYRKLHNEIKRKKSDQESHGERTVTDCAQGRSSESSNGSSVGKRARKNDECITIDDSDDSLAADDSDKDGNSTYDEQSGDDSHKEQSGDDSGKDYKMSAYNYVKEKGSRKVGKPSKKNNVCADDSDKDGIMSSYNYVKEKGSLKVGRSSMMNKAYADDSGKDYNKYFPNYRKGKGSRKVGRHSKNKASLFGGSKLINLMVDSIWKDKDSMLCALKEQDLVKTKLVLPKKNFLSQSTLPLKFQFEDHQCFSAEKMDLDKKVDSLFVDMEMVLMESEIECMKSSLIDDKYFTSTDIVESPATLCRRGVHDTVLDEQLGRVCRCCHIVVLERKYIIPEFCVEAQESPGEKGMVDLDNSFMNQIQFQGNTCGKLESTHGSEGTVLDLISDAEAKLYLHQLEGFEFLWRNIAGDIDFNKLERLSPRGGRGCIISHAPGTGKTRLTILFLQTFLTLYPSCRPVIIAPRGMLLTWEQEFRKWKVNVKFHNMNENKLSLGETVFAASIVNQTRVNKNSINYIRFIKLYSWMKGGSILGISYRLFEKLASDNYKRRCNDTFKKMLLAGPDLLVMDEGHTPRNHDSLMWKALTKVTTQRRIMLSGTPFQNNFSELYNTLCLVNPRFSNQIIRTGSDRKIVKRRGRKRKGNAARDEWAYLTGSIGNNSTGEDRLKKLRSMIEPFVHTHNGCILQKALPGLRRCLIMLKPTDLQFKVLQNLNQFDTFVEQYLSSVISVHPSLVSEKPEFSEHQSELKFHETNPNAGVKTHILIKLIQLSVCRREKVLVFSEFLDPLHYIHMLLERLFSWNLGQEVMYMAGELNIKKRQQMINSFNNKRGKGKVLLASIKACSEGINLVGASRVVLLDVVWNPSVERQAICRAYRLGQEKVVHVYQLVTGMEVKKYDRQAEKERFNELIFCSGEGGGGSKSTTTWSPGDEFVSEDKVLEDMVAERSVREMIETITEKVVDQHQPKDSDLVNTIGFVDLK